ncbi:Sulfotransferase [Hordeum vulgare]|nr:Sulfotransferase [Hordeum vulgare]
MPYTIAIRLAIYTATPTIVGTHPPPVPFSSLYHSHGFLALQISLERAHARARKEMAAIAVRRESEADDVLMEDAIDDEPVPPSSSSAPRSLAYCTMTINEARAHYMDMMRDEREVQADIAYNFQLLWEHSHA